MMRRAVIVLTALALAGCAGLSSYERPQVNVTSVNLGEGDNGLPVFRIGVQVVNPGSIDLALSGMSYSLELDGTRVLSGATADLPRIPAYGSGSFEIEATPDLVGGARVLSALIRGSRDELEFTFRARVDVSGFARDIRITESGTLPLR
jgi:LEA14-like dessication related protein